MSSDSDDRTFEFLREHPSLFADLERVAGRAGTAQIPPTVADHEILGLIGRGGMADVVRARPRDRDEIVAMKLVHRARESEWNVLIREAAILRSIAHPHVVRVHDAGDDGDWAWLTMELVQGESLAERIAHQRAQQPPVGRIDRARLGQAVAWFRQLAAGLSALHAAGVVHRDVKPGNVMIRRDGTACLIDVGLAQPIEPSPWMTGVLAGTLPYMSPEQTLGGLLAMDEASDLYSLAATMFEALCLRRGVEFDEHAAVLQEIAFGPTIVPSRFVDGVPRTIDAIFAHALAKDRRNRYRDAHELVADLAAWEAGHRPHHIREPWLERAARVVRRNPRSVGLGLAAMLASTFALIAGQLEYVTLRDSLIAEIRDDFRAGRGTRAVDRLADSLAAHGDDSAFERFCIESVGEISPILAAEALRAIGLRLPGETVSARQTRLHALGAYLLERDSRPDLVFQLGLARLAERGPDDAIAWMVDRGVAMLGPDATAERGASTHSELLDELAALVTIELHDRAALERVELVIRKTGGGVRDRLGLSLRAYRAIRCASRARVDPDGFGARRGQDLALARHSLDLARDLPEADSSFLELCEALLAWENGDFERATQEFATLCDTGLDGPALRLHGLLAQSLVAGSPPPDAAARITSIAATCGLREDALRLWLAGSTLDFFRPETAFRWLDGLALADLDERTMSDVVEFLVAVLSEFCASGEHSSAVRVARLFDERRRDASAPDPGAERLRELRLLGAWSGVHAASHVVDELAGATDTERHALIGLLAWTRGQAGGLKSTGGSSASEGVAIDGLADLLEARATVDPAQASVVMERGVEKLERVLGHRTAANDASVMPPLDDATRVLVERMLEAARN